MELMVALTILTIGMLAVAAMLKTSSEQSKRSVQNVLGDVIALELTEAVKSQAVVNTLSQLQNVRIQKLMPGSTTLYEYQDANNYTSGTSTTNPSYPNDTQFVERLGQGRGYIYKWHVESQTNSNWPPNLFKLDVTVGWTDVNTPLPSDPNKCFYKTKITTFILGSLS